MLPDLLVEPRFAAVVGDSKRGSAVKMTRDATASPEDGEKTQKSNDQNEQQAETTALVKQRPILILTETDRIRLGKILQPSLQNSLESLVSQLKAAAENDTRGFGTTGQGHHERDGGQEGRQ